MSADLAAFDLAVRSMPESVEKFVFLTYYGARMTKPVKVVAADLGISRGTFYNALKRARSDLFATAQRFKAANLAIPQAEDPEAQLD